MASVFVPSLGDELGVGSPALTSTTGAGYSGSSPFAGVGSIHRTTWPSAWSGPP
ncbi:MAG: hypothetical protein ACKOOG_06395 [Actinomycetota bacterium]